MNYPRRTLLTAAGAAAALVAAPRQMLAGWEPNERYPDPAISILDPSFAKYRIAQSSVERLAVGMRCDATVVDRDLAKLKDDELLEARVSATITDGVVRYANGLA